LGFIWTATESYEMSPPNVLRTTTIDVLNLPVSQAPIGEVGRAGRDGEALDGLEAIVCCEEELSPPDNEHAVANTTTKMRPTRIGVLSGLAATAES
jgi:hypothetical protein